jgi:hypothetical protein
MLDASFLHAAVQDPRKKNMTHRMNQQLARHTFSSMGVWVSRR